MRSVLIVCRANTCRSVMAQVLLERLLAERPGCPPVRVRSAGVGSTARDGMIPSLDACLVLKEAGIDLPETAILSTALRLHPELLTSADLVLTMTAAQKLELAALSWAARGAAELTVERPVFTLRELAGEDGDIADPVGQDEDAYRACRDEIKRCLERSLGRLLDVLDAAAPRP